MEGLLLLTIILSVFSLAISVFVFVLAIRYLWSVPSSLQRIATVLEEQYDECLQGNTVGK